MKRSKTIKSRFALTSLLFSALVLSNFSCDTIDDLAVCEEDDEICEELVIACTSTAEEYFVISGDTIYCASVGNCDGAETELLTSCTIAASTEEDLKIQFKAIMNKVRGLDH